MEISPANPPKPLQKTKKKTKHETKWNKNFPPPIKKKKKKIGANM